MDPKSDDIAKSVLGELEFLEAPPDTVVLCGYVKVTYGPAIALFDDDGNPRVDAGGNPVTQNLRETRLYTSESLDDQWILLPRGSVRHQEPNRGDDEGRSRLWVDANARLTHCRVSDAREIAQTVSAPDDPSSGAYPRGPGG